MNRCSYGKEPFDLRLTVLRMIRKLHILLLVTLAGTFLFGGGYYVKNVMLRTEKEYAATSTYKVEYVIDPNDAGAYYINEMSWNTFVDSKEFTDAVQQHLGEMTVAWDREVLYSNSELAEIISATLASDLRVPATTVTMDTPEMALLIAQAVELAMVEEFVENTKEIIAIRVIDPALEAEEVMPDVRPVRALVLSAILSAFAVLVVLLLQEIGNDSIWLPATLKRRYGVTCVGTIRSKELVVNIRYLFSQAQRCAVCSVDASVAPMEVIEEIQKRLKAEGGATEREATEREWIAAPAPCLCPQSAEVLRQADGVLLVVRAGEHAGKSLEYVLEFLEVQKVKITAALLWDADETLINTYYFGKKWESGKI